MKATENILDEEHIVEPAPFNQEAVRLYEALREANRWLPDPGKVLASTDMELAWGGYGQATLTLTVAINLPKGLIQDPTS